jgi:alpha-tubulin suppressor-like RCC1 family protein
MIRVRVPLRILLATGACALSASGCGDPTGGRGDTPLEFVAVSAGSHHSCALTTDGTAYCWGFDGTSGKPSTVPEAVPGGLRFQSIAAGTVYTCGISTSGETYCWGLGNAFGYEPVNSSVPAPVRVTELSFAQLSAGEFSVCGTTAAGDAHCWSPWTRTLGPVAEGTRLGSLTHYQSTVATTPGGGGGRIYEHRCGIRDGSVLCWGDNRHGELGIGTRDSVFTPTPVASAADFHAVTAGYGFSCALAGDGEVHCWGSGQHGRLGNGGAADALVPTPVDAGIAFARLNSGSHHSCGITSDARAYCWGLNNTGQIGNGEGGTRFQSPALQGPVPTEVLGGHRWTTISAGAWHTCGVTTDGDVYCWGDNLNGQLGDGTTTQRTTPVPVAFER